MTSPTPPLDATQAPARTAAAPAGRRVIDAPIRAFHWLFALSFAGAWLTAESERWHGLHIALGYTFGGLLVFRLGYGLLGPRQARLAALWQRVSGLGDWWRAARAGRLDVPRATTLAMGAAMLLLLAIAAPLVLSGYAGHIEWLGMDDAWEEVHEFFANTALTLVAAHLALLLALSALRGRNLARPMLTGRMPGSGPDLARANHGWLAAVLVLACLGFVGWQAGAVDGSAAGHGDRHGERHGERHHDDD